MSTRRTAATLLSMIAVVGAVPTAAPSRARAQPHPWPRAEESRVGLDFDFWPAYVEALGWEFWWWAFGWDVHAQIRIVEPVYLTFEVPWAAWVSDADPGSSDSGVTFGNPTIGAYWADTVIPGEPGLALFAGGTVSIPTIHDPAADQRWAAGAAVAARGAYDAHRFFPEHVSVRARVGMELRPVDWFYFRSELNPVFHIPTAGDFEMWLEQGNEVEFRHPVGFGGGMRFQQVIMSSYGYARGIHDPEDNLQLAMEPFIGYEPPHPGFFFRLGLLMALDEDLGFAFDHGKVAALRTTFGGKW